MSNRLIIKRGLNMDQPKTHKPRRTYINKFSLVKPQLLEDFLSW